MKHFLFASLLLASTHALAQDGQALYRRDCASCHDMGVDRAPSRETLQTMTAERVLTAMESGPMISMASRDNGAERRAIAQFVAGKALSARDLSMTPPSSAMCTSAGTFGRRATDANWSGWGNGTDNTRFQQGPLANIGPANVSRLKVKWAFGFPGDLDANAQPTVYADRVFVGSQSGIVYALSKDSGCVHWFFKAGGAVRGAVTVAQTGTGAAPAVTAFFGDLAGNVYALDAMTGTQRWTIKADAHPVARVVGSVVFHEGRLYVPVASAEETAGASSTYECCKFRGSV
ncbi:MAG TPA: PQQ-binding-like beta-propeller repeat protein, partial [Vicinamibacterales bacterium]|nr:PQQ-binding-like beta-propeller repeat protein [Vicinamibacterales bacterium]